MQSVDNNGSIFYPKVFDLIEDDLIEKFTANISIVTALSSI